MNSVRNRQESLSRSFLVRVGLAVAVAYIAHQFGWEWLRFATSEIILRFASRLGFETTRTSFDTISIQGTFFQFKISCTFIDVILGAIPLVWNGEKGLRRNLQRLAAMMVAMFNFNILRLAVSQLLYARGVPWPLADNVLGGVSYFVVWLVITDRYWGRQSGKRLQDLASAP
jgi:hypothetical protein